jgi:K+-transporting ATPase A subunit
VADLATAFGGSAAIAFLVAAGIVYEIIAAACSSPQTAEINADRRAGTLMKWVHLGIAQAALFVFIAAAIDAKHRAAIIAGGLTAAVLMYLQYVYAMKAGLASGGPGTEAY